MNEWQDSDEYNNIRSEILQPIIDKGIQQMPADIAFLQQLADGSIERTPGWAKAISRTRMTLRYAGFVCLIPTSDDGLSIEETAGILAKAGQQYLDSLSAQS